MIKQLAKLVGLDPASALSRLVDKAVAERRTELERERAALEPALAVDVDAHREKAREAYGHWRALKYDGIPTGQVHPITRLPVFHAATHEQIIAADGASNRAKDEADSAERGKRDAESRIQEIDAALRAQDAADELLADNRRRHSEHGEKLARRRAIADAIEQRMRPDVAAKAAVLSRLRDAEVERQSATVARQVAATVAGAAVPDLAEGDDESAAAIDRAQRVHRTARDVLAAAEKQLAALDREIATLADGFADRRARYAHAVARAAESRWEALLALLGPEASMLVGARRAAGNSSAPNAPRVDDVAAQRVAAAITSDFKPLPAVDEPAVPASKSDPVEGDDEDGRPEPEAATG